MRIAIVTETFLPSTDGVVTRLCASIKWLQKNGHQVCIIAPDLGVNNYYGARVVGIPAKNLFFYKGKKFSLPHPKVAKILKEFNPEILHVVNPALLGAAGVYYGEKLGLPMIASYHTNVPDYAEYYKMPFFKPALWWYLRKLHNKADINLCTSNAIKEELKQQDIQNVHLWERGVDVEQFDPSNYTSEMRRRLTNNMPDKKLLIFVGRLAPEKEIDRIKTVLRQSDDFYLAIIGDGPHREYLEDLFQGTNTVFTGFLHGKELAQAYASADCFVFPSTTETLGLVILEAMASGLPVIAAKSGPTCEQIDDGINGLLYHPEEESGFLDTVNQIKDNELTKRLSENAYKTGQRYGWSGPSEQLFNFYLQVLAEKKEIEEIS
ncbi:MAG: glycosyltransferase family 1 protein [Firmicutes bacterium]|nr:glycosyltransferase family 1 protein [Bacillota bacterium]